jgi:RNA polymerase sigma factor (sigma-70 family)
MRLGGGDPNFTPGEAEGMVRELRTYLRAETELRDREDVEGAFRMRVRATSLVSELARRLEKRFERYAWAEFRDMPQLIDDAVAEMFSELCRRTKDTSETNGLMERRFNLVVQTLITDAIRKVRRHNGLTKEGGPATGGYTLISLEEASERAASAGSGERAVQPLEVADPDAEEPYNRVVEQMLGLIAVTWLNDLPVRQRRVVKDRLVDGLPWTEVARRVGVTPRAAQMDLEKALATLRTMLAKELEGNGQ